jgi:SAM-dependent methyltransferase
MSDEAGRNGWLSGGDRVYAEMLSSFGDDFKRGAALKSTQPLVDALPRGSRVLDLGCGEGFIAGYLSSLGYDVEGVDLSPTLVEQARKSYPDIRFGAMDAVDIDQLGSTYHAIFSHTVLHSVSDIATVFTKARDLLEDPGLFVITICHPCFYNEDTLAYYGDSVEEVPPQRELVIKRYRTAHGFSKRIGRRAIAPHYHRPLSEWFREARKNRFSVDFDEWFVDAAHAQGEVPEIPLFARFLLRKQP